MSEKSHTIASFSRDAERIRLHVNLVHIASKTASRIHTSMPLSFPTSSIPHRICKHHEEIFVSCLQTFVQIWMPSIPCSAGFEHSSMLRLSRTEVCFTRILLDSYANSHGRLYVEATMYVSPCLSNKVQVRTLARFSIQICRLDIRSTWKYFALQI